MRSLVRLSTLLLGAALTSCSGDDSAASPDADDAGPAPDAGLVDAGAPAAPPIAVIDAAGLGERLAEGGVQVVDVRPAALFAAGHVPGAVHLPTGGLRGNMGGVPGQVVARGAAEAIFEAAGIDPTQALVVVGARNDTGTSRALWTLALYGAAQVRLLDGGHPAWVDAGGEIETADTASPTRWTDAPTQEGLRTDKAWLLEHHRDPDVRIYDARTPGEFAAGHIPGAISANWTENLGAGGRFNDAAAIRAFHGDPTAPTLVVYCQSGARASVTWALLKAVGYEDVRLYDGSWNEWGADPATPKETD